MLTNVLAFLSTKWWLLVAPVGAVVLFRVAIEIYRRRRGVPQPAPPSRTAAMIGDVQDVLRQQSAAIEGQSETIARLTATVSRLDGEIERYRQQRDIDARLARLHASAHALLEAWERADREMAHTILGLDAAVAATKAHREDLSRSAARLLNVLVRDQALDAVGLPVDRPPFAEGAGVSGPNPAEAAGVVVRPTEGG